MDTITLNPADAEAASIHDLEQPVVGAKHAAHVLSIVLDDILASKHPSMQSADGYTALLVDDETIEALAHAMEQVIGFTRKAADDYSQVMHVRP